MGQGERTELDCVEEELQGSSELPRDRVLVCSSADG